MNNKQSTDVYTIHGGRAVSTTKNLLMDEQELGRTGEEFYEDMQCVLSDDAPWKRIQRNTFTGWVNEHLKLVNRHIDYLQAELSDGLNLIALIEVLSQKKLPRYNRRPNFRSQKLENVSVALDFLENTERIRLVNIDATHIVDGKLKLILGLIWTLILHYSISLPMWEFEQLDLFRPGRDVTPKQKLMNWIKEKLPPELPISNFKSDWSDGRAIGALVDACAPGLYPDWHKKDPKNGLENAKQAMDLAERWLGVSQLIQPDEMINQKVDEQSRLTYLSQYPNAKLKPGAPIGLNVDPTPARCYGKVIEPTGFHVDAPARLHVETFADTKCHVDGIVINTKRKKEKCEVDLLRDKNQTYECTYHPTMRGQDKLIVEFNGPKVTKSSFLLPIEGKSGNASQCCVHGPDIEPKHFKIDTAVKPTIDPSRDKILQEQDTLKRHYDNFPNIDDATNEATPDMKKAEELTKSILEKKPSGKPSERDTLCHVLNELLSNVDQQCLFYDSSNGTHLHDASGNIADIDAEDKAFVLKLSSSRGLGGSRAEKTDAAELELVQALKTVIEQNGSHPVIEDVRNRLAKAHEVDKSRIVIKNLYDGTFTIVYTVLNLAATAVQYFTNLSAKLKSQFDQFLSAKIHPLLYRPAFDISYFDERGNKIFGSRCETYQVGPPGSTKTYTTAAGWTRYGLKVLGKYGKDDWLHPFGHAGNWYRAFHGTKNAKLEDFSDESKKFVDKETALLDAMASIYKDGFRLARKHFYGDGVYCSPNPKFLESGYVGTAQIDTQQGLKNFKCMLQVAVNPEGVHIASDDIWVARTPQDIRVYGLLIKEA